jgi:RNA polymerase sigma factor (sigma-70 family)
MATPPDELALASAPTSAAGLEVIVTEHYPRLIRLAGLVCHRVDDAEDAVQAALERAWRQRGTLADPERLRPWLDRIVVREAIRSRHRVRPTVVDLTLAVDHQADEWATVRQAFASLSREQRAVVALHLYLGYPVAETAEIVGAPIETVRSRLRLARERLRQLLAEEADR